MTSNCSAQSFQLLADSGRGFSWEAQLLAQHSTSPTSCGVAPLPCEDKDVSTHCTCPSSWIP